MSKKKIDYFVFEPGIGKNENLRPNAVALLTANKTFLQQQVIRFINYNITAGIAPYIGYTYASSKCTRDVGFFIDAIIHDLRYGGNVKIRQVANYFWINGQPMIRGDVTPETTGQAYLRDTINDYIFTNTTVPTTYGSPSSPQVKFVGSNAEANADTANSDLWDLLSDVITNGTQAIPAKETGVSSVRLLGRYTSSELLLITDTENGNILYNFSDPANSVTIEYKTGKSSADNEPIGDLDFPSWWQTGDCITTLYLSENTATLSVSNDLQIFVDEPSMQIRPWEFGTDAIERMRVAAPQAMLDADFEYGLQPTKWQAIGMMRNYPSLYELTGTDLSVVSMITDASVNTGNFGSSLITVITSGAHGFAVGTPITVKGLNIAVSGFSRAEGSFLVAGVQSSISFTYYASAKVGSASGQSLYTSFVQIRQAGFYTGAAVGAATYALFSNGTTASVISKFDTPVGSFQIAFDGVSPTAGSPVSGSPFIPAGTAVSGVVGAATVTTSLKNPSEVTDTTLVLDDLTGVQAGMAIENADGDAIFINSISSNTVYLSGEFGFALAGSDNIFASVSGTNVTQTGINATFTVSRSAGIYQVLDSGDSTINGEGYAVGDRLTILGTDLGGLTPNNDIVVAVTGVDSSGGITSFTKEGAAISGGATYTGILQSGTTGSGSGATLTVIRTGGTGTYGITLTGGGTGYVDTEVVTFAGTSFGGTSPANDIVITVDGTAFGTGALVDFTITPGAIGVTGDAEYISVTATNNPTTGSAAVFTVTALAGAYTAQTGIAPTFTGTGTGYFQDQRILIAGTDLGGISPLNDCTLTITSASGGTIISVSTDGTPASGGEVLIYPAMTLSESITNTIANGTTLSVGAIATIQIDFSSNHGLLPGSGILSNITSTPAPEFASTLKTLPSGTWVGTAFANGTFIAVATGTNITARSIDGQTWASGGTLPASTTWTAAAAGAIADGSIYFVAVASGGTQAAYSTNGGVSWTTATLPSSGTWSAVTYFNGYFVAVRSGSNAGAYSTDGINWFASILSATAAWSDVVGGVIGSSNYLIAVATTSSTAASYSVDNGVNWTAMGALPSSANWVSVAFGNSRFVAVASGGTAAAVSTNGTSWTAATLPSSASWNNIVFGDDVFLLISSGTTNASTSFTGTTGSWTDRTLAGSAAWEETAYGNYSGLGIFAVVGNGTSAMSISLTSANHQLAAGPFIITSVPTPTSIRYPARATGTLNTASGALTGILYARPDSFFTHRPFDGGVQLGTGGPQHAAQAIRQSKKYIRYQSGKGIMYTTGALFSPNYNLASAVADDYPANSPIRFTTDDTDHGLQPGGIVDVVGFSSFEYNGTYTVESISSSRTFVARALVPLSTLNAELGPDTKISIKEWAGSTVRVGAFDDQNGIFYQYDGRELAVVRRSSTFQTTGTVAISTESNLITGTGTRFTEQLKVHDKIVLRGMTHTVTGISSNTSMTVAPDWRGVSSITGAKICLTEELYVPQSQWNMDKADGTGPSGYNIIPTRMQMIGIQYSWYAAGFIEFMIRGADGKFVFLHRIRNSNINTEAYMRTANLPVRYEVENRSAIGKLLKPITATSTTLDLADASRFPSSGTIYLDNELISYSGKSGRELLGLSRAANLSNFAAGQNRTYTAGAATTHSAGTGVALVSCTITPTINHWGSAILTDGMFDEDRGYIFNYAATGLSASLEKQTAFMIRLAPSVSNALVGDLGERDLLNRAQLLLSEIAITADSGTGAIVIEGVLNPRNYPADPTKISWSGLASAAAGGQPSFAQIALGGSINWGGTPLTTGTAAVQGALTTTIAARAFSAVTTTIQAVANPAGITGYANALSNTRTDFFILNTTYTALLTTTPLRVGDGLSTATYLASGQSISSITPSFGGTAYTKIEMNTPATVTSPNNNNINITRTSSISTGYNRAFDVSRTDFLVTDTDNLAQGLLAGDGVSVATFLTAAQTISTITPSYARVAGVLYTRIVMNTSANSTSGAATNVTTTVTASGTAASYVSTNYLFFTNSSWNASGASVGTRLATSVTQFPSNTSVTAVTTRTLGATTVRRISFTQNSNATIAAAATLTFQFGDSQFALPGEQVFSFLSQPGATNSLNLEKLKELTTTAIGGRGAFPNGPDVLAINIYKVSGTAVPAGLILRWGEAQA
jgi:hypothetical protein